MKLKEALKKFNFLKRLSVPDIIIERMANHLSRTLEGSNEVYATPLAKKSDPCVVLYEWDLVVKQNLHLLNKPLTDLEFSNRSKFGPRSIAVKWFERIFGFKETFDNQDDKHIPRFKFTPGDNSLYMISFKEAFESIKGSSSAGLPFLVKKSKALPQLMENFDEILKRQDPCVLYTRTTENKKTRNVWGYPFADTILEMLFYIPFLKLQKTKWNRAALVSPDAVAQRITELILYAIETGRILYSVDFAAFDASVKYQYIIEAFEYIKSCFATAFHPTLNYICERMYSIGIVVPSGIYKRKHGIPSGSTFTNEVDSIVQFGIASLCPFISEKKCQVQGDDGAYTMYESEIPEFESVFKYAGLKLEKSKSVISSNYIVFCQNLYHIDYMKNNHIGGIYPTYRAINRILFQERYVDFGKVGIQGKDYYGIRALTILENCKYHPLFPQLVRFVMSKERFNLDISDDGINKYCTYLNQSRKTVENLNHQYGAVVIGIRGFEAYKIAKEILAEEEFSNMDPAVSKED